MDVQRAQDVIGRTNSDGPPRPADSTREDVAARIADVGEAAVCTSIVVASELRHGASKPGAEMLLESGLTGRRRPNASM